MARGTAPASAPDIDIHLDRLGGYMTVAIRAFRCWYAYQHREAPAEYPMVADADHWVSAYAEFRQASSTEDVGARIVELLAGLVVGVLAADHA